jgi:hypothetical protein
VLAACSKDEIGEVTIGNCAGHHDATDAKGDDGQGVFATMLQILWQGALELEDELLQIAVEGLARPFRRPPDLCAEGRQGTPLCHSVTMTAAEIPTSGFSEPFPAVPVTQPREELTMGLGHRPRKRFFKERFFRWEMRIEATPADVTRRCAS